LMAGRATPDPEVLLCRARKTEPGLRSISPYTAQAEGLAW
jgi:nicotinate-nucleotide pyrophosphorylase